LTCELALATRQVGVILASQTPLLTFSSHRAASKNDDKERVSVEAIVSRFLFIILK